MGLILTENLNDEGILGIWKKEENLDFLAQHVEIKAHEIERFNKIKNETRKIEWLTTRMLLASLVGKKKNIDYYPNGKPKITKSPYRISISHSKNFVCILLSATKEPGIDIEQIADRVTKVKGKFLSQAELDWCQSLEQYTLCWSAKEAIFKTIGQNVDFKDILIHAFEPVNQGTFKANLINNEKQSFAINYQIIEDNVLTYTLPEIICKT